MNTAALLNIEPLGPRIVGGKRKNSVEFMGVSPTEKKAPRGSIRPTPFSIGVQVVEWLILMWWVRHRTVLVFPDPFLLKFICSYAQ
jgi:hypothetical protein